MTDSKPLRITIALSALFIGLALIFAAVFPVVAQQLGWLPTASVPMMAGGMMHGGYMNGSMFGFGMPWMGFGFFVWPLLILGLIVLAVIWFARSKPAAQ